MSQPTHGYTRDGRPVHTHSADYLPRARFNLRETREAVRRVEGFNAKLALLITRSVGTMACAYVFGAVALISLPAALSSGQVIIIVAWVAQTFLQLVLLAVIMVGQSVQSAASDARAAKEFEDTERIVDALDLRTQGGLTEIKDSLDALIAQGQARSPRAKPRAKTPTATAGTAVSSTQHDGTSVRRGR